MEGLRISERQLIHAAVDGLADAVRRYEAASGLRGTYVPMAEALSWSALLDDHLRSHHWYEPERAVHPGGQIQPGLRYARNFATHQMVALSESGDAYLSFPLFSGDGGSLFKTSFRWLAIDELPEPGRRGRYTTEHETCYRERLAGADVGGTLSLAASWFERGREFALNDPAEDAAQE